MEQKLTVGDIAKELLDNGAIRIGPWILTKESSTEWHITNGRGTGKITFTDLFDAVVAMSFMS